MAKITKIKLNSTPEKERGREGEEERERERFGESETLNSRLVNITRLGGLALESLLEKTAGAGEDEANRVKSLAAPF